MAKRTEALELAVLGVLSEGDAHGYELRKRLILVMGLFTTISFGSLYPTLKGLVKRGLLSESLHDGGELAKRNRVVYSLTESGREYFEKLVGDIGPGAWEDEFFSIRMSLFSKTNSDVRIRIMEGRRTRLEERCAVLKENLNRSLARQDAYLQELQEHDLNNLEGEVRWLNDLIARERNSTALDRKIIRETTNPARVGQVTNNQ